MISQTTDLNIPPEPDFHPPEPDSHPTPYHPDPRLDPQQLPPNCEHRHSPLRDLDLDELSKQQAFRSSSRLFVCALREVCLDSGIGLKGEALERLRNPPFHPATVDDDPGVDFALSRFLILKHSLEAACEDIRTAAHRCLLESDT
ncbi:hypothetical protein EDB19DRAFT_1835560 [Suillus lakei]|jgi:hypothetical protein|nr:hypothetical protein EDB19DRAFT_1835560 [Suillus lakei]